MPCMCGATDCPSCGPAQGYEVVRMYQPGRGFVLVNPEDIEDDMLTEEETEEQKWRT